VFIHLFIVLVEGTIEQIKSQFPELSEELRINALGPARLKQDLWNDELSKVRNL
jgi:hypothetical protein